MAEKKKNTSGSRNKTTAAAKPKPASAAKKKTGTGAATPSKTPVKRALTEQERSIRNTVKGIVFAALAVITFLSFFDGAMGKIGQGLKTVMCWMMGATSIGIPVLFLLLAAGCIAGRKTGITKNGVCITTLYGILSCAWTTITIPLNGMNFTDYVSLAAKQGMEVSGGGALTSWIVWGAVSLCNVIGAMILYIAAALILLVILSGITFSTLFDKREESEEPIEEEAPSRLSLHRKKTEPAPSAPASDGGGAKKRNFEIPSISPEEELSPADRRALAKQQRNREKELNHAEPMRPPEQEPPKVVLSTEFKERKKAPRPTEEFQFPEDLLKTPQQIEDEAKALMVEEAQTTASIPTKPQTVPAPKKEELSKEELNAEVGQVAQAVRENTDQERPYVYPPLSLLDFKPDENAASAREELRQTAKNLMQSLDNFSVGTTYLDAVRGPTVTRYELQPNAGVKISKITNLADDIALHLAAPGIRIEAPIPGRSAIGIEIPNKIANVVYLKETISSDAFRNHKSNIAVALGKDISGQNVCVDLAKMPHILIAGSTGSGKSVCINTILMSILYKSTPDQVRLILVDPKVVELSVYNGIPHLLIPVVTEAKKAAGALQWAVTEMMQRYKLFAEKSVRNYQGYNEKLSEGEKPLPQIVIIIDELADLMMVAPGEVEDSICRLAQMARAAGMHLVIATQRPSADVLTGLIKTNVPSRIAFAVSSQIDSRIVLDQSGAEKLIGRGDMLYNPLGAPKPMRVQGCYVSDEEIERVVSFIKEHSKAEQSEEQSKILEEIEKNSKETVKGKKGITGSIGGTDEDGDFVDNGDDVLLPRAVELVIKAGMASTSGLQRSLGVGHSRAGRLMDQMEKKGYIGPYQGSKPRDVLITMDQFNEQRATQGDLTEGAGNE